MVHNAFLKTRVYFPPSDFIKKKNLPEDLNSIYIAKELQIWKCLAEDCHHEEHPPKEDFDRIRGSSKFDVVPRYSRNNSQNALIWWPVSWPVCWKKNYTFVQPIHIVQTLGNLFLPGTHSYEM